MNRAIKEWKKRSRNELRSGGRSLQRQKSKAKIKGLMSTLAEQKVILRREVRARINTIRKQSAGSVIGNLLALKQLEVWNSSQTILFFAPMPAEPDIWPLLAESLAAGKTVALPRFFAGDHAYIACRVGDLQNDVRIATFGIREPIESWSRSVTPIGPGARAGVAFDAHGCRLGRGKGFYDRLLSTVRGSKCGVAFDEQIVDEVPPRRMTNV